MEDCRIEALQDKNRRVNNRRIRTRRVQAHSGSSSSKLSEAVGSSTVQVTR